MGLYNGRDYFLDKFLYLLSGKISNKYRIYPDFIEGEDYLVLKENKKDILEML